MVLQNGSDELGLVQALHVLLLSQALQEVSVMLIREEVNAREVENLESHWHVHGVFALSHVGTLHFRGRLSKLTSIFFLKLFGKLIRLSLFKRGDLIIFGVTTLDEQGSIDGILVIEIEGQ